MGKHNWDRLAAGSGIVFVILVLISSFLPGSPPMISDKNAKIAHYFVSHHRSGLVSDILGGLALIAFLWFLASLAARLRGGGEPRIAAVAFGGGLVAAAGATASTMVTAALFYGVASESPALARPLYVVAQIGTTLIWFPIAALTLAAGIAAWRSSVMPAWYGALSGLAALITVFGGGAVAHKGFYSPTGAYGLVTIIAFSVWVLITSGLLMKQATGEPAAA